MTIPFKGYANKLDIGKKNFRSFVEKQVSIAEPIPLVHSTDSYALRSIVEEDQIKPDECHVFKNEMLTYLFYRRPSFRPNADENPTSMSHYAPICLIFKPNFVAQIKRIFPFDSGAFMKDLYIPHIHSKMKLGDFALAPQENTPSKLVTTFFGNNENYLSAKLDASNNFDQDEFEVQSYVSIVQARDSNILDSRSSTIEIQTSNIINFEDNVDAVVLPSSFIDGALGKKLLARSIDPLPYDLYSRFRPNEYTSKIHELCIAYYIRKGLIKKENF